MRLIPVPKFLKCTCIDNSGSRGTGTCLQDSFLLKTIAIIDSPAGVLASPLYTATLLHTYSKSIVMLHVYTCTHVCVCVCVCGIT